MREIQYGLSPSSAPAGSPVMFFPTSVNVAPLSRLTCTNPSSVPAQTTPAMARDSEMAMTVLKLVMPSFFESCAVVPAAPITVILQRSTWRVRSALAIHRSPWLSERNSRLPPIHIVRGLCGESRMGVFQFQRYVWPGSAFTTLGVPPNRPPAPPPPPPPAPPPPARPAAGAAITLPSTQEPGAGAGGASVAGGATGRMLTVRPVRRSVRTVRPSCASEYTVWRSVGSTAVWNPSPLFSKLTRNQLFSRMPTRLRVALGPPHPSLSCSPEYTLYG